MRRFELLLLIFLTVCWAVAVAVSKGWLPVAGHFDLGLYQLYCLASILGWLGGNTFLLRRASATRLPSSVHPLLRDRLWLLYFLHPPAVLYLLRGLASTSQQEAAPLVALYAHGVFLLFFMVPVSFQLTRRGSRRPRLRPPDGP